MTDLPETPSQTAGPFVHIGLLPEGQAAGPATLAGPVAGPDTPGPRIRIEGAVLDGTGAAISDAVIEIWQADAEGRMGARGAFRGWTRLDCLDGGWALDTIKPGAVDGQAPHIALWIVARGLNQGLHTRLYFPDEDNAADPVLCAIEQPARRATLIAEAAGAGTYRFYVRLQGDGETVFLDP